MHFVQQAYDIQSFVRFGVDSWKHCEMGSVDADADGSINFLMTPKTDTLGLSVDGA